MGSDHIHAAVSLSPAKELPVNMRPELVCTVEPRQRIEACLPVLLPTELSRLFMFVVYDAITLFIFILYFKVIPI